jgi:myo-inositol-1(or 4)-monophosphatase
MTAASGDRLDEVYAFAVQLGKDAGNMLMDAARSRFGDAGQTGQVVEEKDSAVDIVTKTDEGMSSVSAPGANGSCRTLEKLSVAE